MMGGNGAMVAAPLHILVTNNGTHSANAWATAVMEGLVTLDRTMPLERRESAILVRHKLQQMLVGAFNEVKPTSSFADVDALVRTCMGRVAEIFCSTYWAQSIEHDGLRAEVEQFLRRNLLSAADLAVRTE